MRVRHPIFDIRSPRTILRPASAIKDPEPAPSRDKPKCLRLTNLKHYSIPAIMHHASSTTIPHLPKHPPKHERTRACTYARTPEHPKTHSAAAAPLASHSPQQSNRCYQSDKPHGGCSLPRHHPQTTKTLSPLPDVTLHACLATLAFTCIHLPHQQHHNVCWATSLHA